MCVFLGGRGVTLFSADYLKLYLVVTPVNKRSKICLSLCLTFKGDDRISSILGHCINVHKPDSYMHGQDSLIAP